MDYLPELTATAHQLANSLENRLHSTEGLVQRFPPSRYVQLCTYSDTTKYCCDMPKPQIMYLQQIDREYGPNVACLYNQLALTRLSLGYVDALEDRDLPPPALKLTMEWFERIYKDINQNDPAYYDLLDPGNQHLDDLRQDFAVCTGKAMPVGGAWIVEHRRLIKSKLFNNSTFSEKPGESTAPRLYRVLKRAAAVSGTYDGLMFLRSKWYALTGRYGDYLVIHTANRYRRYFSEKHLNTAYVNIALILQMNSKLLGLYRSSWFLDPKVVEIEPKLAFLSRTPVQQGAKYGPVRAVKDSEVDAILRRSDLRSDAYNQGNYLPWVWGYLWPRDELLAWADQASQSSR